MRPTTQLVLVFALMFTACAAPLAVKWIDVRDQALEIRAPSSHVDITVTFEGNPTGDNEPLSKAYTNAVKEDVRALLKNVAARDLGAPAGEALLFHWVGVPTHDTTKPVVYNVMWNEVGPYKVVMSHKTPMKDAIVKNARGGIVRNDGNPNNASPLFFQLTKTRKSFNGPRVAPWLRKEGIMDKRHCDYISDLGTWNLSSSQNTPCRDKNKQRTVLRLEIKLYCCHPWSGVLGSENRHFSLRTDGNFIGTPAICGAIRVYKSLPLRSQAGAEAIESITTKGRAGTDPVMKAVFVQYSICNTRVSIIDLPN
ncbi:MAG: hypothetical protein NXY57DRAFT_1062498 [Lentinula lateritia]|nr:MAG: hypothetical protein NXY57DRAFT_1062498 [Lentinula lateritia]